MHLTFLFFKMTDHLENECTEYDMVCPNEKFGGCTFKVSLHKVSDLKLW